MGRTVSLIFIDYTEAFDLMSHKFFDKVLKDAGVNNKERAVFRAIYSSVSAYTAVSDTSIKSAVFPIRRGVVQGGITSPLFFILVLDVILRKHDVRPDTGVLLLGQTILRTLGYADDTSLIDEVDAVGVLRATERLTSIVEGSVSDVRE